MAYANKLFTNNFLEYASYVIKDRAIPHINDGLKPVQRRILHTLLEMDDGKFHKVANVVGHAMRYHPHGDASIYSALVVLANKELLIDKQGNFGNIFTGDEASAARYIECRIKPLAKDILYNPEITIFESSYDGRNKEPVTFPAKVPMVLVLGAEGIAVGMSTKILPHNYVEVLEAVKAALQKKKFQLYPDFPTGGFIDVSSYEDGMGKVLARAKLDTSDPKRIVIKELPYGTTTESLISSIEGAVKKNKVKIAEINDYTSEEVEIEIKLARGVYSREVEDALYAFTDCEMSISVNLLVIMEGKPALVTVSEVIACHAKQLVDILTKELKLEQGHLRDKLHARTLEQIFVEERIYKNIEQMKSHQGVINAVLKGFEPFHNQIRREVTVEDVERLLKIPIRRISLYDINKAKKEMAEIRARLKEIKAHLTDTTKYAVGFLDKLIESAGEEFVRQTEIISFEKVDVREAAQRNLPLRYDRETGYLGYGVATGTHLFDVSVYDRILVVRKTGYYSVMDVPEKLFVDKGMLACGHADKETLAKKVFTIIYKNKEGYPYIKRCSIEGYILDKTYPMVPEGTSVIKLTTDQNVEAVVSYKATARMKITEESFPVKDFLVKSVKAAGVRLAPKEVKSAKFVKVKKSTSKKGSGKKSNPKPSADGP